MTEQTTKYLQQDVASYDMTDEQNYASDKTVPLEEIKIDTVGTSNYIDNDKSQLTIDKMTKPDSSKILQTAAMTEEVYADHVKSSKENASKNVSKGCWSRTIRILRSFWATRLTEDSNDKETLIKTTIRELIIYIIFLVVICLITFSQTSPTYYYYTTVMQQLFLDTKTTQGNTFRSINTIEQWWEYMSPDGPFLNGIYWDKWYNNENIEVGEENFIFYENKLLGVPRIRQLRIAPDTCSVHEDFTNDIDHCYDQYNKNNQDMESYGEKHNDAFRWSSEDELDGSSHSSKLRYTYDGAGYVQDLGVTKNISDFRINQLKKFRWIDRQTRVVFIDFTVYNANINLFCVVRLVSEFPASGGMVPSWEFRTVKMLPTNSGWDTFIRILEYIYIVMIIYYIIEEFLEIKVHKLDYFKSFWNILDIVIIIVSICAVAFRIYRQRKVSELIDELKTKTKQYPDFEFLAFWSLQYIYMIAINVFLAWIKLFKYISFNRTMTQLQQTLTRCATDILGFAVMFMIIFVAFAQAGYMVFGTVVADFSEFPESLFTLFRIILGDFNFHELEQAHRTLGPIFFMTYVFLVFFVLLNMFLAIINDTYSEVKADIALQQSEFELSDYIKRGYDKVLRKLKLKKKHIKDIQDALQTADINQDKKLDWEEWRNDLRMRGIPDNEIEAVFAKYDTDGDMVLNEDEQKQLHEDLRAHQDQVDKDMKEVKESNKGNDENLTEPDDKLLGISIKSNSPDLKNIQSSEQIVEKLSNHFVGHEDFDGVSRRIDRLERSVGAVVTKIDSIIMKLEALDRVKVKADKKRRRNSIFGASVVDDNTNQFVQRHDMARNDDSETNYTESRPNSALPNSKRGESRQTDFSKISSKSGK